MNNFTYQSGCNYWSSQWAAYMWKYYDSSIIEKDLKTLSENGVKILRIFPNWEDFQPLEEISFWEPAEGERYPYKYRVHDVPMQLTKYPESGLDEKQVENMKDFLSRAQKYNIKIILSFLTGWMSGRKFVPRAFTNRNLIADEEVVMLECNFIRDLINEVKDFDCIIGYEPGNETSCLGNETVITDWVKMKYIAQSWLKHITDTIRLTDPTKPIYSGIASGTILGGFNLMDQGKYFDFVTPHPYPAFKQHCMNEKMTEMRASLHGAADIAYYQGLSQRPAMIQEIGCLGPEVICDENVPKYIERTYITSYMEGSTGYLWWCAFDQSHLNFAPYDFVTMENSMGTITVDHKVKPQFLPVMEKLRKDVEKIGKLPLPDKDAVVIVTPWVNLWDVCYGSYMLSAQSGYSLDYTYESQPFKDSDRYILPSVETLNGLNKYYSKKLEDKIKDGASLLITSNKGVVTNFSSLTGLKVVGKDYFEKDRIFEIDGEKLSIKCSGTNYLESVSAKVLLKDDEGNILMSVNDFGKGKVYFFNAPIEVAYNYLQYPENTDLYKVYKMFFADKKPVFAVDDKKILTRIYSCDNGDKKVVLYNFNDYKDVDYVVDENYYIKQVEFGSCDEKLHFNKNYVLLILAKK